MMGTEVGIRFTESEADCLADTLPHWPNFPYVTEILSAAKTCYKLAQISNVYDNLFAGTAEAPDVAESLLHGIGPANRLGIKCVWVDRPDRGEGTRRTNAVPDLVTPDLFYLRGRQGYWLA